MKAEKWIILWLVIIIPAFVIAALCVYQVDPYFHYHKPHTDRYYYSLYNQRGQNDGISRHFEYDALITGTSMTENFRTSEMDEVFGCHSVKVPYSGSTYKEINDNIAVALRANKDLKMVVRCLDMDHFLDPPDLMRTDLGTYPTYLYDDNIFNDVKYLLNRDLLFRSAVMMTDYIRPGGAEPGIDSFDKYSRWQELFSFGINAVLYEYSNWQILKATGKATLTDGEITMERPDKYYHLTEDEKETVRRNVTENITALADKYPDVDFYYYYSPYSILEWWELLGEGIIYKRIEAEKLVTELILDHENIRLFSYNTRFDIITDLNNYRDLTHSASWINSLVLKWMHDGDYRLTKDNYEEYYREEYDFFLNYDYESLNGQIDYEADLYAAALLNEEMTGVEPVDLLGANLMEITSGNGRITVNLDQGYNYLVFKVQSVSDQTAPAVSIYDEAGSLIAEELVKRSENDGAVHQHAVDMSTLDGNVTIVLNQDELSGFCFKDVRLY